MSLQCCQCVESTHVFTCILIHPVKIGKNAPASMIISVPWMWNLVTGWSYGFTASHVAGQVIQMQAHYQGKYELLLVDCGIHLSQHASCLHT